MHSGEMLENMVRIRIKPKSGIHPRRPPPGTHPHYHHRHHHHQRSGSRSSQEYLGRAPLRRDRRRGQRVDDRVRFPGGRGCPTAGSRRRRRFCRGVRWLRRRRAGGGPGSGRGSGWGRRWGWQLGRPRDRETGGGTCGGQHYVACHRYLYIDVNRVYPSDCKHQPASRKCPGRTRKSAKPEHAACVEGNA